MMSEWEAVGKRISCRSYQNRLVDDATVAALRDCLSSITNETGLHMELVHTPDSTLKLAGAMFSGAIHTYAVFCGKDDDITAEKLGFYGERFVLYATSLGLGTCWIAGTYDKDSVKVELAPDEKIWDVVPIGYPTEDIPLKQKMIRTMLRKKDRKIDDFLESETAFDDLPDWIDNGIRSILLGPSAVNQQPVNIVYENGSVSMRIRKNGHGLQCNDMGIAKYQFMVGAAVRGVNGTWQWGDGGSFTEAK